MLKNGHIPWRQNYQETASTLSDPHYSTQVNTAVCVVCENEGDICIVINCIPKDDVMIMVYKLIK